MHFATILQTFFMKSSHFLPPDCYGRGTDKSDMFPIREQKQEHRAGNTPQGRNTSYVGNPNRLPADFNKSRHVVAGPDSWTPPDTGSTTMRETMERLRDCRVHEPRAHPHVRSRDPPRPQTRTTPAPAARTMTTRRVSGKTPRCALRRTRVGRTPRLRKTTFRLPGRTCPVFRRLRDSLPTGRRRAMAAVRSGGSPRGRVLSEDELHGHRLRSDKDLRQSAGSRAQRSLRGTDIPPSRQRSQFPVGRADRRSPMRRSTNRNIRSRSIESKNLLMSASTYPVDPAPSYSARQSVKRVARSAPRPVLSSTAAAPRGRIPPSGFDMSQRRDMAQQRGKLLLRIPLDVLPYPPRRSVRNSPAPRPARVSSSRIPPGHGSSLHRPRLGLRRLVRPLPRHHGHVRLPCACSRRRLALHHVPAPPSRFISLGTARGLPMSRQRTYVRARVL